jgi:hypothetical protein
MEARDKEIIFEKELSAEDVQIAEYFRRLPSLLDLPGENEVILEKLEEKRVRENISTSGNFSLPIELQKFSSDFEEAIDDESEEDFFDGKELSIHKIPHGFLLEIFKGMSLNLITEYSCNSKKNLNNSFLAIICEINQIFHQLCDILLVAYNNKPLRNTLIRRTLKAINNLASRLNELELKAKNTLDFSAEIAKLNDSRTELLNILFDKN